MVVGSVICHNFLSNGVLTAQKAYHTGAAVTFEMTGILGILNDAFSKAGPMASSAGAMRLQWNGAETGSGRARPE